MKYGFLKEIRLMKVPKFIGKSYKTEINFIAVTEETVFETKLASAKTLFLKNYKCE